MRTILSFFFGIFILQGHVLAETFSFDKGLDQWGSWGTGLGSHDESVGLKKKGSLWMSADWGDVQTVHYSWNNLRPGLYKVTAYVRAQDVQASSEGSSFWHFYDGGKGTENVFLSLHGSYDWRKVEYTLSVSQKNLSIWFRLKSPGQVWVDDFSISPVSSAQALTLGEVKPLVYHAKKHEVKKQTFHESVLLDFDRASGSHPFEVIQNSRKQKMGKFSSREYYNFDPQDYRSGNWSDYDRISLDVYNGNNHFSEFYLTLGDASSHNYWSQLNHKTHLSPGWNHLNFSLSQFVGERGSHRFNRPLNLKNLKKWFFVVDPNEKYPRSSSYFVDNIKISRHPYPVPPTGVYAFDFTSHKDFSTSTFQKVTSQHTYRTERGFGFVEPQFWRVEDSQWAANTLRYSIGALKGHFRTRLPNGNYKLQLVIDRLGYWDPSFWKDRTVYINGRPVFKESRTSGMEYLRDWLQFENVVPETDDHPYDLYLKRLLRPLEFSAKVTNGVLDLEWEGDATGISLNTLVIWNTKQDEKARNFLDEMDQWNRKEFDWMSRSIEASGKAIKNTSLATLIRPSLTLSPLGNAPSMGKEIKLYGFKGEEPYQLIQLRGEGETRFELTDLVHATGKKIEASKIHLSELIPQYISPDLNHETYMVAGKYLRPLHAQSVGLKSNHTKYIWLQVPLEEKLPSGSYRGRLSVKNGKLKEDFPISLSYQNSDLPKVDFPVGFFGPEPVSYSYFSDEGLEKLRRNYRHKAIEILGKKGFTTISGLPEAKIIMDGDLWRLDTTAPDETMTVAMRSGMSKTFFSYGGKFPQQFFDGSLKPSGMKEEDFYQRSGEVLGIYLTQKGMPSIVHTFSDEAGGYSDKINEDLAFARKMKSALPFLKLGGFSSPSDPRTAELNKFFDFGFYSNISKAQLKQMSQTSKWGSYNASPGNLDDPRYTFGPGLYYSRRMGLSHYLEWHASSVNNYPYYDLDGRESDVTMFMPTSDGQLLPTLRFKLAVEGLNAYRKLALMDHLIKHKVGKTDDLRSAHRWIGAYQAGASSAKENILKPDAAFDFDRFSAELNHHLDRLLN